MRISPWSRSCLRRHPIADGDVIATLNGLPVTSRKAEARDGG
jgi:hypothetical protein